MAHRSWDKFRKVDQGYFRFIDWLEKERFGSREIVYHFPVFVGQVNLARYLMLYDLYGRVKELGGNIADVGTYKGASFLFFAKLIALYERGAATQVHGFDWFKGMVAGKRDAASMTGRYVSDYRTLRQLVGKQGLEDVAVLHRMDLARHFKGFLDANPHMRFKLSFVDCGIESVLRAVIGPLWERTVEGGIMVFDHFGLEASPTESDAIQAVVSPHRICHMPQCRQPTAYVVKNSGR